MDAGSYAGEAADQMADTWLPKVYEADVICDEGDADLAPNVRLVAGFNDAYQPGYQRI